MQEVVIKGTHERYKIQDMAYPFPEIGTVNIRMVVVDDDEKPIEFLLCNPQNILYRKIPYTQKLMDEIIEDSDNMIRQYHEQVEREQEEQEKQTAEKKIKHEGYYG